jgi:hypothetical protein
MMVSQPEPSLASSPIALARLSMPGFFLSALSPFSPIQKKPFDTMSASALRSFFSAAAVICLRKASKLGSLTIGGAAMATAL